MAKTQAPAIDMKALRDEVLQREPPLTVEPGRALLRNALALAKEAGCTIAYGTFGYAGLNGECCDPIGAVARLHPAFRPDMDGKSILAASLLGWSADQVWAFVSGYDVEDEKVRERGFIDPRAKAWPEFVRLGQQMREEFCRR